MDDVKKVYREAEAKAKEFGRDIDGHQPSDDVGNAGDDIRKDLGNLGDDIRRESSDRDRGDRVDEAADLHATVDDRDL